METRIGATHIINDTLYIVAEINISTRTSRVTVAHTDMRSHAKLACHILLHFECDDFQPGDIVTEHLERITLIKESDESSALVITKVHTFRKEQPYVSASGT